jgi:hypothetical protein
MKSWKWGLGLIRFMPAEKPSSKPKVLLNDHVEHLLLYPLCKVVSGVKDVEERPSSVNFFGART